MTAHDGMANQLPKLVIRKNGPDDLRAHCGVQHDKELGAQIGIHRAQVSRVLSHDHDAGNKFIAGVIARCGVEFTFTKVFEIEK
jgi:hypothetical protein